MSKKAAFHEVFHNVPKSVVKTGKTGMAKQKMMVAIALSKAGLSREQKKSVRGSGAMTEDEMTKGHRVMEVCPMHKGKMR